MQLAGDALAVQQSTVVLLNPGPGVKLGLARLDPYSCTLALWSYNQADDRYTPILVSSPDAV